MRRSSASQAAGSEVLALAVPSSDAQNLPT